MPKKYNPIKTTQVEAEQFLGWENAESMCKWIPGLFYVPQGFDHSLRSTEERNLDSKPSKNAPEFLVFPNPGGQDIRINLKTWLVVDTDGKTYMYTDSDFQKQYQEAADPLTASDYFGPKK